MTSASAVAMSLHLERAAACQREAAQLRALHDQWAQRGALPYTLADLRHAARAMRRQAAAAHHRARQCLEHLFTTDIQGAAA